MTFRASNSAPVQEYAAAKGLIAGIRRSALLRVQQFSTGTDGYEIMDLLGQLVNAKAKMLEVAAIPGLAAYAQAQENDPTYDVVAEFQNVVSLVTAAIDEIVATYPTSAGGYAEVFSINPSGAKTPRAFNSAQVAALSTRLQAIADAIS